MLDERPDDFFARNLFFQAVLGLVSASRRLDAAIAPASEGEPAPLDEPFLLFVLGLIAFRERAMSALANAAADAPPAQSGEVVRLREILR